MAISASELGSPAEVVLKMLSEAARLAPSSARIGENLKAFIKSHDNRAAKAEWDYREDSADYPVREPIISATLAEPALPRESAAAV
jgi:hypothetical protein